jgi:hypothetical protein
VQPATALFAQWVRSLSFAGAHGDLRSLGPWADWEAQLAEERRLLLPASSLREWIVEGTFGRQASFQETSAAGRLHRNSILAMTASLPVQRDGRRVRGAYEAATQMVEPITADAMGAAEELGYC